MLLIASGQKKLKKTPLNWLLPVMYFTAILPAFVSDGVMENYLEHPKGLMTFIFYSLASLIIINLVDSTKKLEKSLQLAHNYWGNNRYYLHLAMFQLRSVGRLYIFFYGTV